jgi:hypothetical protein
MRAAIVAIVMLAPLQGCYTPHQSGCDSFVLQSVPVGSQFSAALRQAEAEGFRCEPPERSAKLLLRDQQSVSECTRQRSGFMFSCLERFEIAVDSGARVVQVAPGPIACAGL